MSDNGIYGEVCIGTDFRLRKYPELRQVAQRLRKKIVICSKDLKEITETPEVCPVRKLVGLNYDSRFPFTTQRLENDRVDHWSYVRELVVIPVSNEELIDKIKGLDLPNRIDIVVKDFRNKVLIEGFRKSFIPEPGKKHLPEEDGKIYYITSEVANDRFKKYIECLLLPCVQRHFDFEVRRRDMSCELKFKEESNV